VSEHPPTERRYRVTQGATGVGLVLTGDQFDRLLAAHEHGWDAVLEVLDAIRKEKDQ
jgi:hypothetical protein